MPAPRPIPPSTAATPQLHSPHGCRRSICFSAADVLPCFPCRWRVHPFRMSVEHDPRWLPNNKMLVQQMKVVSQCGGVGRGSWNVWIGFFSRRVSPLEVPWGGRLWFSCPLEEVLLWFWDLLCSIFTKNCLVQPSEPNEICCCQAALRAGEIK